MADSEPSNFQLAIPIAQLHPSLEADGTYISGLVTLIWPYSTSKKESSLLLVEPDFRLRRNKGQVRVVFNGASAKEFARAGINSGDRILLALDGTRYERAEVTIATPGRGVEWDLHFRKLLNFRAERQDQQALSVTVDNPPSTPTSPSASPDPATDLLNVGDYVTQGKHGNPGKGWDSPAFLKRKRISSLPFFESSYDPFSTEVDTDAQPLPKKSKFGRKSGEWRFTERTPSPEEAAEVEWPVFPSDKTSGLELTTSPMAGVNAAYITAPPSDEDGLAQEEKETMKGVSRATFDDVLASAMDNVSELSGGDPELVADTSSAEDAQQEMQVYNLNPLNGDETTKGVMEMPAEHRVLGTRTEPEESFEKIVAANEPTIEPKEAAPDLSQPAHAVGQSEKDLASAGETISDNEHQREISRTSLAVEHLRSYEQGAVSPSVQSQSYDYPITADLAQAPGIDVFPTTLAVKQSAYKPFGYGVDGTSFSRLKSEQHSLSPSGSNTEGETYTNPRLVQADVSIVPQVSTQLFQAADPTTNRDLGPSNEPLQEIIPNRSELARTNDGYDDEGTEVTNNNRFTKLEITERKHMMGARDDFSRSDPKPKEAPSPSKFQDVGSPWVEIPRRRDLSRQYSESEEILGEDDVVREQETESDEQEEDVEDKSSDAEDLVSSSDEDSADSSRKGLANDINEASKKDQQEILSVVGEAGLDVRAADFRDDEEQKTDSADLFDQSPPLLNASAPQSFQHNVPTIIGLGRQSPAQEARPPLPSSTVEVIDLEDESEDEQVIMESLRDTYLIAGPPQEEVLTHVSKEPAPNDRQVEAREIQHHFDIDEHAQEEVTVRPAENPLAIDYDLPPGKIADVARDGVEGPLENPMDESPDRYSNDKNDVQPGSVKDITSQASPNQSAEPYLEGTPFALFDSANDFRVTSNQNEFLSFDPLERTELKLESPARIESSSPPFIPEDDFLDVTQYSDYYEENIAEQKGPTQHLTDRSHKDAKMAGDKRAPSPESLLSTVTHHDGVTAEDAPKIDEQVREVYPELTTTAMEMLATSRPLVHAPDIPIDPSLLTKNEVKTQIMTPATTQRTVIVSQTSRVSFRSLSPPSPHLPTPSLTQSASNEHLPAPKTPTIPRTFNVIEKLKSRSREKSDKRTSDIAPVISPWFKPKRSNHMALSREESPSPHSSHHLSQVVADEVERSSSQVIPDSEDERREDESEPGDQISCSAEEATTTNKVAQKSRQSPVVSKSLATSGAQPLPSISTSLPGLRTHLSYFAPLSTLSSHFSTSISTFSTLVSSTKPERAKKGPRDYVMTLYLSDPSLHQQNSSSPPSTPYFKPSKSSSKITAMLFRPHPSALPNLGTGDAILLRNFKVTSLKGKMGLTSTESSAWAVFQSNKGWEPSVRGPPVEFGPEERAYASGLGRWWGSVKDQYERKAKGKAKVVASPSSSSNVETPLKHELRDGKEYVDDPSTIEEAKSERRDARRSTHVLRDGHTWRDDV